MFYLCLPESNKDLSDVPTGYLKHYRRAITHTRTSWRYQVTEDVNNVFALTDRNLKRRFSYWEISRIPREKGNRQIRGHVTSDSKSRWTFSRSKNWFPWQHTDPCNETGRLSFREVLDDNLNKWHFSEQKVSAFTFLALCNKAKRGGELWRACRQRAGLQFPEHTAAFYVSKLSGQDVVCCGASLFSTVRARGRASRFTLIW